MRQPAGSTSDGARPAKLSEEIAERLIAGIIEGKFRFGEKLPPERDLAKYLDVGRPTIREALRTLAVLGLVEVRRGEGTYVIEQHAEFVAKAFGWAILLDPQTTHEVVEVRVAIECELARLAARRATPEDVDELRQLLAAMEERRDDSRGFAEADLEFHLTIGRVARNVALSRILVAVRSLLAQWITRALLRPTTVDVASAHHEAILAAIAAGDEAAAYDAMRVHLIEMAALLAQPAEA